MSDKATVEVEMMKEEVVTSDRAVMTIKRIRATKERSSRGAVAVFLLNLCYLNIFSVSIFS